MTKVKLPKYIAGVTTNTTSHHSLIDHRNYTVIFLTFIKNIHDNKTIILGKYHEIQN